MGLKLLRARRLCFAEPFVSATCPRGARVTKFDLGSRDGVELLVTPGQSGWERVNVGSALALVLSSLAKLQALKTAAGLETS